MVIKTAIEQLDEMGDIDGTGDGEQLSPSDPDFENPVPYGEAEQTAQAPVAVVRTRDLTHSMRVFIAAKLAGSTSKDAYKQAYPNDTSSDQTISSSAYKLSKHPLVSKALADAWGQTEEALVEDMSASKRYVIQSLIALSKSAKQEGSRLKALELLGKASGAFITTAAVEAPAPSAAQLKKELAGHLKLLKQQ
jgi:hypothetical protein